MYDQTALDAAWDLVKGFDTATREGLRVAASVSGLQAEVEGVKLIDLARAAVGLSHAGLAGRGLDEERYLAPLVQSLVLEETQADRWLRLYNTDWAGDLGRIYAASSL
jgi:glutamate--cysteine ligase